MNWLLVFTIIAAIFFAGLVAFQLGLAMGMPWGKAAYGGRNAVLSQRLRITSGMAVVIWLVAMLLVIRRYQGEGLAFLNAGNVTFVLWLVAAYLALGVLMNAISPSPLERNIWTPATAIALFATVAVNLSA